ncbi:MAG: hypothetical protein V1728_01640 [Candidatus Micrarchaeota archaeon]
MSTELSLARQKLKGVSLLLVVLFNALIYLLLWFIGAVDWRPAFIFSAISLLIEFFVVLPQMDRTFAKLEKDEEEKK